MNYKAIVDGLEKECDIGIKYYSSILNEVLDYHPIDIHKARAKRETYKMVKTIIEDLKDKNK